jgi:serine/threonine protein kinase
LRQGPGRYPDALEALRQAVSLDPVRYATHEERKYPTEAILGAGGMGCAFLCRQPVKGNRRVVVKTFWRAAPGTVEDIFAEATTMDRAGRAQVPALLDYGFAQGGKRPCIVMEYLDGYQDGEAWLKEHGPLPLTDGLDLGRRVLEALVTAHAAGVVHLDLKPANLLLKAAGDGIEVKVIDFGLAQVAERLDGARGTGVSRGGLSVLASSIAGTCDFASPEQMGQAQYGTPGPRSDLYAFGATWYRLLTGRHPNNRRAKYMPDGCPSDLYELVQDLLEHDPKDRPESAEAVLALLGTIIPGGATPSPRPPEPKTLPLPPVEDIHGWSTSKVQPVQQATTAVVGQPAVFRVRLGSGGEAQATGYPTQLNIGNHVSSQEGYIAFPNDKLDTIRWARSKAAWIAANIATADPCYRGLPGGRSLTELLADRSIWLNYHPTMVDFGETNYAGGKEVAISVTSFRVGRWAVLATLVHELAHVDGVRGALQPRAAELAVLACGLGKWSEITTGWDGAITPYNPNIRG